MMKILVTGGGGFLGREIVRQLLARGESVRVLTRSAQPELAAAGCECVRADIADADAVRAACAGCDAVIHTAAKAGVWGTAGDFFRANVLGSRAVAAGCRAAGVPFLVHTSTPSVVFNGRGIAGGDESLPLTTSCPCAYPLTKAQAERETLAADCTAGSGTTGGATAGGGLRVIALRPHLIWGAGDPHLVPRVVAAARAGRLHVVGTGANRVDLTHVRNAAAAHLLALDALRRGALSGRAYFISDGAPVVLWDWVNALLARVGAPPVTRSAPLPVVKFAGALCELAWRLLPLRGEPPMTRFTAHELAADHWFDISAARRDLGYAPAVNTAAALDELVQSLAK
ncbi:MAG: NAD-dependent epimerase/dehydratase family protein [Puniceicoccales bacterium]|jgi:nucleoside-diphosphate-sugar epimerase|nr:NAD-dependent epimerase/dehydratase family protein [Puniceicoccales bacterium]